MRRVVLDANVYISATLRPEGPPGQIVERFLRDQAFDVILSTAIIDETLRALAYPRIRKHIRAGVDPNLWFEDIIVLAHVVADVDEAPAVSADADDDRYLAVAIEGKATLVVSGDRDLLTIKEHQGVSIVTPRAFLDQLGPTPTST